MNFNYFLPTRILFGPGQIKHLHEQRLPGKKALIVISNGKSTKDNGYLDQVTDELNQAGVGHVVFNQIQPNPSKDNVMDGAEHAKANGCDFIIGLGGGSCIDAAKAIAAMATNDGDIWDYIYGGSGLGHPLQNKALPIVAISTTAGTGSEADTFGVITNEETHEKIAFGGYDCLYPVLAVVDPQMMTTVPPLLTAYQGFDALFHSVEGYVSSAANLFTDMCALTTIENVAGSLAKTVTDGNDLEARAKVAFGNTLSGFVMSIGGLTSQHSLEHALSASHPGLPHGAGLIMISRAYFTHLAQNHACDERMIAMAKAMGKADATKAMDFVEALVALQNACGVGNLKMSEYGIEKKNLAKYAEEARRTMPALFNGDPIQLSDADCTKILEDSYK